MMMKKIFNLFLVTLAVTALLGCKKKPLDTFNGDSSGVSIYFQTPSVSLSNGKAFSFGYYPGSLQDTVFNLDIAVTGLPSNIEREINLQPATGATLIEGVNYDFITKKVMPAGKVTTSLKIKFRRTSDIQANAKFVVFNLVDNQSFNTLLKQRVSSSRDTISLLQYGYLIDDVLAAPYAWSAAPYKANLDNYLGAYSKVKLQLLVDIFNLDSSVFTNMKYAQDGYFSVAVLSYWGGYMKLWLAREAVAGRIWKDENGNVITMGPRAS